MIVRELLTKFGFQIDTGSVDKVESTVASVKDSAEGIIPAAEKASKAFGAAMEKTASYSKEAMDQIVGVFERLPGEMSAIDEQAKIFGDSFNAARARVDALAASIRDVTRAGGTLENTPALIGLVGAHSSASAALGETEAAESGGMLGSLGEHAGGMLRDGAMAFGGGIGAFFAAEGAVEHYAEFQQTLQKAGAAMRASQSDIDDLRQRALEWASDLGRSPREIGEAMQELASTGFSKAAIEQMTPIAVKLARAGLVDVGTATQIVGSTTRAYYGNNAAEAGHVGDLIAMVHDLGGIKIPQLAETLQYSAPTFHALGQSLEDLGSITAVLGQVGISGSRAGSALRTMALRLAAPAGLGKMAVKAMGLGSSYQAAAKGGTTMLALLGLSPRQLEDAKGNMLPIVEILKMIDAKTSHMGNMERAAIFSKIFGIRGSSQALAIADKLEHSFGQIDYKVHHAQGSLDKMYGIVNRGLLPSWQKMTSQLEVTADTIVKALTPALEFVMRLVTAVAGAVSVILAATGYLGGMAGKAFADLKMRAGGSMSSWSSSQQAKVNALQAEAHNLHGNITVNVHVAGTNASAKEIGSHAAQALVNAIRLPMAHAARMVPRTQN